IFQTRKRSLIMSRIRGKNTAPEKRVRCLLHALGYRFRLHRTDLPGTPDIVLPRYKKVIFVHGCFWHGHSGCRRAALPTSNRQFWKSKIAGNKCRDKKNLRKLRSSEWRALVI